MLLIDEYAAGSRQVVKGKGAALTIFQYEFILFAVAADGDVDRILCELVTSIEGLDSGAGDGRRLTFLPGQL